MCFSINDFRLREINRKSEIGNYMMDGILIIDKPAGVTSHDVVYRARKILKEKRIGHTGTLDPFATGVLVLMVGRATRLAQFLNTDVKEYQAAVRFGFETDTGDLTGNPRIADFSEIENRKHLRWKIENELEESLKKLRGEILQTPPMYSAKKVQGKRLYKLAREGKEIERKPVPVTIYKFEVVRQTASLSNASVISDNEQAGNLSKKNEQAGNLFYINEDETIDLNVRVVCSAGTYIRVLAESLGAELDTGAHLASLRRTSAGDFKIEQSVTLEKLQEMVDSNRLNEILLPMKTALSKLESLHLTPADTKKVCNGMALKIEKVDWEDGEAVSLFDENGNLIAVAFYKDVAKRLQPGVVLATLKN